MMGLLNAMEASCARPLVDYCGLNCIALPTPAATTLRCCTSHLHDDSDNDGFGCYYDGYDPCFPHSVAPSASLMMLNPLTLYQMNPPVRAPQAAKTMHLIASRVLEWFFDILPTCLLQPQARVPVPYNKKAMSL